MAKRGIRAFQAGYGGSERCWKGRAAWSRLDWAKRPNNGFGQAVLVKGSDGGKEGVSLRIDWSAQVCGRSRQDGLGGRLENKIFCPLSGRDGQD